jgi:hypothetical protein
MSFGWKLILMGIRISSGGMTSVWGYLSFDVTVSQ